MLVRAAYLIQGAKNPFWTQLGLDTEIYDRWARAIASGHGLGEAPFSQAPFFPVILGVVYAIFGPDPVRALWLQLLPATLSVLLVSWSAERLWGARAAWIAGLLLALYKPAIFFTGELLPSVWSMWLSALLLFLVVPSWTGSASRLRTFFAGLVGGLLGLAQPTALLLVLPFLVIPFIEVGRDRMRRVAPLVLGLAIPLAASLAYNGIAGKSWTPIAVNRGINLYIGNGPEANGAYVRPPGMREDRDLLGNAAAEAVLRARGAWSGDAPLPPGRADRYWTGEALRAMSRAPVRTVALFARKLGFVISAHEISQVESLRFESRYASILRAPLPGMALLVALAAFGVVIAWSDRRVRWMLASLALAAFAIAIFFVTARFRLVLVPWLTLLAVAPAAHFGRVSPRRRTIATVTALLVLALSLISATGIDVKSSDGQYLYRLGVLAERSKSLEDAKERYAEALALDSTLAKAEINLGTLLAREGRYDEARAHVERGVRLDAQTAIGRVSLAQLEQIAGRKERALVLFREAHAIDPTLLSAAEGIAYVGYELGKVTEGVAQAVEIARTAPVGSLPLRRARTLAAVVNARQALANDAWEQSVALRAADLLLVHGNAKEATAGYRALRDDPIAGLAAQVTLDQLQREQR